MILKYSLTKWDITSDNISRIMNYLSSNKKRLYFLEGDEKIENYFQKYNIHKTDAKNNLTYCSNDNGYHFVKYKKGYFIDKSFLDTFNIINHIKRRMLV